MKSDFHFLFFSWILLVTGAVDWTILEYQHIYLQTDFIVMEKLTPSKPFYFVTVSEDDQLPESKEKIKTELEFRRNKDELKKLYKMAVEALQSGQFQSINSCAKHFQITYNTLRRLYREDKAFVGSGSRSLVFTPSEEAKITKFVNEKLSLGRDIDFNQLCLIMKELIGALRSADPSRTFPSSFELDFPNASYARRFVIRNNLVLRRNLHLNPSPVVLSVGELQKFRNEIIEETLSTMLVMEEGEVMPEKVLSRPPPPPSPGPPSPDPPSPGPPAPSSDPGPEPSNIVSPRDHSLEERKQNLEKFELVMLNPAQIAEFGDHFKRGRRLEVPDYLYQSWLVLKLASASVKRRKDISEETQKKIPKGIHRSRHRRTNFMIK